MSQKEFTEKKEFDIKTVRTVCDICGETVKEATVRLRVDTIEERVMQGSLQDNSPFGPGRYVSDHAIDVCSPECLKTNVNGVTLLLQSKIVPNTPADKRDADFVKKSSYPEMKEASPKMTGLASAISSVFKLRD